MVVTKKVNSLRGAGDTSTLEKKKALKRYLFMPSDNESHRNFSSDAILFSVFFLIPEDMFCLKTFPAQLQYAR